MCIYSYIFVAIYIKKLSHTWKNFQEQKVFFLFYIASLLCKNFNKIRPVIKKILNFVNDPPNEEAKIYTYSIMSSKNLKINSL